MRGFIFETAWLHVFASTSPANQLINQNSPTSFLFFMQSSKQSDILRCSALELNAVLCNYYAEHIYICVVHFRNTR